MEPLSNLINEKDPGWPIVTDWIKSAKNKVEVLPVDKVKANDVLYKTQVTTRSPMGAIIYETGGILIDNGWIRILGSGSDRMKRSLTDWNLGKAYTQFGQKISFLLVADDAIGGFYIINSGAFGTDLGKIYYFAPDSLEYEPLDMTYSGFLNFCFSGDLNKFYDGLRWATWQKDAAELDPDKVFNFYPFLWTKEGKNIETLSRKPISVEEQYHLNVDFRKQLSEK